MKEKTLAYLLLLATLVAVGCGPSSSGATETPVEPTLAPLEQPTSDQPSDALLQDAQAYAADVGVDLEEALNRLGLQDAIGNLNARLQSEQRDTFAGLWVEHQPAYRLVVAFTRDGEATLAPYIEGTALADIAEVRSAAVTYEELQAIQRETSQLLGPLPIPISSAINIRENLVELYITDQAAFDAGIQANGIQLPEHVRIEVIYEPIGDDLPFEVVPDDSIYLPQLKTRSASFMELKAWR